MDSKTNKKLMSFLELSAFSLKIANAKKKYLIVPFIFSFAFFATAYWFFWLFVIGVIGGIFAGFDELKIIIIVFPLLMFVFSILFKTSETYIIKCFFQDERESFKGWLDLIKKRGLWLCVCDYIFFNLIFFIGTLFYLPMGLFELLDIDILYYFVPSSIIILLISSVILFVIQFINNSIILFGFNLSEAINQVRMITRGYRLELLGKFLLSIAVPIIITVFEVHRRFTIHVDYGNIILMAFFSFAITFWINIFCTVMFLNIYNLNRLQDIE